MNRWRWILPAFAGIAAGVLAWWALPAVPAVEPVAWAPAPAPAASPARGSDSREAPARASAMQASPVEQITVDLCGTGRFPVRVIDEATDAFEALPAPLGRWALQDLHERLLRALAAGDARQRVAAWLLRQPDTPDPATQATWAATLLAEARAGGDAQALRWAATACGLTEDAARCRRELAWARVQAEPDNGLHWLEWGQEASSTAEREEAWRGLVRARHWHEHPAGLTAVTQAALAALQPAAPGYLRARVARETQGRDSAQAPAGFAWLERTCGERPADCAPVAQRLFDEGDSAALVQQAAALALQLGWPDERVQAVAAATQAFHAGLPRWPADAPAAQACGAVESQLAHADAVARRGEVPRTLR